MVWEIIGQEWSKLREEFGSAWILSKIPGPERKKGLAVPGVPPESCILLDLHYIDSGLGLRLPIPLHVLQSTNSQAGSWQIIPSSPGWTSQGTTGECNESFQTLPQQLLEDNGKRCTHGKKQGGRFSWKDSVSSRAHVQYWFRITQNTLHRTATCIQTAPVGI